MSQPSAPRRPLRLSRITLGVVALLALSVIGAAPTQACNTPFGPVIVNPAPEPPSGCGDGVVSRSEQCDGTLGDATCENIEYGYVGGTLHCNSRCQFDTRECNYPICGNGRVEMSEECEGNVTRPCSEGYVGTQTCNPKTCLWTGTCKSESLACGNGKRDDYEECEGADLNGESCSRLSDRSNPNGVLRCSPSCQFDLSGCADERGYCGDGIVQPGYEDCDGNGTISCQEYAKLKGLPADYYASGGPVSCQWCTFYEQRCIVNRNHCGNGIREPEYGETCDGKDVGGETCQSRGFLFGSMECTSDCRYINPYTCWGGCMTGFRGISICQ